MMNPHMISGLVILSQTDKPCKVSMLAPLIRRDILQKKFKNVIRECIFSRKLENRNWVFLTTSSYIYGQDECPQGTSPSNNCMNEWLGEPVLVFQLPGRGILRNFINNLVKTIFKISAMTLLCNSGKTKTLGDMPPGLFCFPMSYFFNSYYFVFFTRLLI